MCERERDRERERESVGVACSLLCGRLVGIKSGPTNTSFLRPVLVMHTSCQLLTLKPVAGEAWKQPGASSEVAARERGPLGRMKHRGFRGNPLSQGPGLKPTHQSMRSHCSAFTCCQSMSFRLMLSRCRHSGLFVQGHNQRGPSELNKGCNLEM